MAEKADTLSREAEVESPLAASYQAVPALDPPRTLDEMMEVAREEHAHEAAREGL